MPQEKTTTYSKCKKYYIVEDCDYQAGFNGSSSSSKWSVYSVSDGCIGNYFGGFNDCGGLLQQTNTCKN